MLGITFGNLEGDANVNWRKKIKQDKCKTGFMEKKKFVYNGQDFSHKG